MSDAARAWSRAQPNAATAINASNNIASAAAQIRRRPAPDGRESAVAVGLVICADYRTNFQ